MTKATDTGKWEEMVEAGAAGIALSYGVSWSLVPADQKQVLRNDARNALEAALQAAGVKELVEKTARPIDEAPMDGTPIVVRYRTTMRFLPYKPTSREAQNGKKGRWQEVSEYGRWSNTPYRPDEWYPAALSDNGEG